MLPISSLAAKVFWCLSVTDPVQKRKSLTFCHNEEVGRVKPVRQQKLCANKASQRVEAANGVEFSFIVLARICSPPHTKMTRILLHGIDVHGRLFYHLKVLHKFVPFCPVDGIRGLVDIQRA